jgi:carbon monoxide dehydrogenase subunit G
MGKTYQTIVIDAPVDRVWRAVSNFHDMTWAPNVITDVETVGDIPGNRVGAVRVLNGLFRETLLELDEEERTFSYSIDDGPPPVSKDEVKNYVGQVSVQPATEGNGTRVEWSSTWEDNEGPAYEFCHSIYVALLDDMKKSLE